MAFENFKPEKIQKLTKIKFILAITKDNSCFKNFLATPKYQINFLLLSSIIITISGKD